MRPPKEKQDDEKVAVMVKLTQKDIRDAMDLTCNETYAAAVAYMFRFGLKVYKAVHNIKK